MSDKSEDLRQWLKETDSATKGKVTASRPKPPPKSEQGGTQNSTNSTDKGSNEKKS